MDQEQGVDQFHDSELGDVYDLYNACNGATVAGVLAAHAISGVPAAARPADAPWQDRPTRFAERKRSKE